MVKPTPLFACALAAAAAVLNAQTSVPTPPGSRWSFAANYALKETVDGNVCLQDVGGTAHKRSLVTSATLGIGLGCQRNPAFKAAFAYAPELVRNHSYASENHVAHRASFNFNGSSGSTAWELTNALVLIDGGNQGPIFDVANRGDIPAVGGIPLRERRDALALRNGFRTEQRARTGPDIRRFEKRPAGFDPDEMLWLINASLSWPPAKRDTVTATLSRFQQPAFSSQSVYEDIVNDLAWRHQYAKRLSAAVGFRVYGGAWQAPVNREDWINTPSASLSCAFHKRLAAEAAYSHDSVGSRVPNTRGREFTRHLFSVSARGSF